MTEPRSSVLANHDAYDVYVLAAPLEQAAELPADAIAFDFIPLLALAAGATSPAGTTTRSVRKYPRAYVLWLQAIDYCLAKPVTLMNLSLGPGDELHHSDTDPDPLYVAIAAGAGRGRYCVVAAGNSYGDDSLQYLARSPFAISVGAVDAERHLLEYSARGIPGTSGPTVVALGNALDNTQSPGTSFAAPRVTFVFAWIRTLIDRIIADLRQIVAGTWDPLAEMGVPIVAILDTGATEEAFNAITTAVPKFLSRTRHQNEWLRGVFSTIDRTYGLKSRVANDFAGAKRALEAIAEPLPEYQRHEVGAGLIDVDNFYSAIRSFTPELWIRMFADDAAKAGTIPRAELDALNTRFGALYEPEYAELLVEHFDAGVGKYILRVVG